MVYCGKPSSACNECRRRRTRCDEARPSCKQGVRGCRVCTGYRDLLTLMFRDENENKRLARNGQNRKPAPTREAVLLKWKEMGGELEPDPRTKFREERVGRLESLLKHSSEEEQGICYVFRNYAYEDPDYGMDFSHAIMKDGGLFAYLPEMLGGSRARLNCLDDAILALGLAGISNTRRDSLMMKKAVARYMRAVSGISALLPKVNEATKDDVLVSVLLLGLYETNCSSKPSSMKYWAQHANGASSLLSLRGDSQLQTPTGRRIFVRVRFQFMKTCVQRNIPIPNSITRLSLLALPHESPDHAAATGLSFIITRFAALRARLQTTSVTEILKAATEIEQQLEKWATNLPDGYKYQIIPTPETQRQYENDEREIYGDTYHVYTDVLLASAWNSYRCARTLVLELLCTYILLLTPPDPDTDLQIYTWKSRISELNNDILASVLFHFNTHIQLQNNLWTRPPPRALNGEMLMWNLHRCALSGMVGCDEEGERKKRWICARLRAIAREMGILHAEGLAVVAEMGREVSVWELARSREDEVQGVLGEMGEDVDWGSDGVTRERSPSF
ncbi:uncharacterized protein LY89DRAFT_35296 [Mollisia scopiformis]|uniref:Zn(2)-C6 fungal-type domain-containing protein n=1 Tax=Mollisia scopiformis TaxID=149040 RepID=A0A194XCV8_MOLSC|nr:uncharacterized protein LY89DRAFT_35296 [Mollisia scopiformis]KUJ18010.1 hypothetical protein LY89DRAFT_35296 [Mollisia scopiformis]